LSRWNPYLPVSWVRAEFGLYAAFRVVVAKLLHRMRG
jgi:hypothetical protein